MQLEHVPELDYWTVLVMAKKRQKSILKKKPNKITILKIQNDQFLLS